MIKRLKIGLNIVLDTLSGSIGPLIPLMLGASMFKMLVAVLGPDMLNVIATDSDLYTLFTLVGDAGFYFFPIYLGYTSAQKMGTNPMIGMLLGAVLIHPTLISLVGAETPLTVYGIPANLQNYVSTLLPIILSVAVLKWVEKGLNNLIPDMLKAVFVPFLSILIMLPIMLCVCGPIGGFIGNGLSTLLLGLNDVPFIGFFAIALIAALWQLIVMVGMHQVFVASMVIVFSSNGMESVVSPAATISSIAVAGMLLGAFLKTKDKKEKALTISYLIASFIGGITEPGIYGTALKFKRPFIGLIAGGFIGGLYASITGVTSYALVPVASFFAVTGFVGGSKENFLNGIISCIIAFIVSSAITYFVGFNKNNSTCK